MLPRLTRDVDQTRFPESEAKRLESLQDIGQALDLRLTGALDQPRRQLRVLEDELTRSQQLAQLRRHLCWRELPQGVLRGGASVLAALANLTGDVRGGGGGTDVRQRA